jgi:hypothetical protein
MPRTARLMLRNCPRHVAWSVHAQEAVFAQPREVHYYL